MPRDAEYRTSAPRFASVATEQEAQGADCSMKQADFIDVDAAYQQCLQLYHEHFQRYQVYIVGSGSTLFSNICRGAGSTVDLFPQTYFTIRRLQTWAHSPNDAWSQDWHSVGVDFYKSLLEFPKTESLNAGPPRTSSWERPIEGIGRRNSSGTGSDR